MRRNQSFEQYLIVGGILIFFFWMSLGILKPVILGLFLALVMYPASQYFSKLPRTVAAGLLTAALFFGVLLPLAYIAYVIRGDAITMARSLLNLSATPIDPNGATDSTTLDLTGALRFVHDKISTVVPLAREDFDDAVKKIGSALGIYATSWITSVATSIPALLMESIVFLLSVFFGLADGPRLIQFVLKVLPFNPREVSIFASTTESITRGVVVGSLISGAIQGTIIGTALLVLGVPRALFFGTMTFVFSFIPFLGSLPVGIGAMIYLLTQDRTGAAVAMLIAFAVASVSDNIVKPLALKGQLEMHPLLAFVSVVGGLSLFGFTGLFLGPLIAALTMVSVEMLTLHDDFDDQTVA